MKISYRRTGGFAGMILSYDIDIDNLSPEEASELETLVSEADFFSLPEEISAESAGMDQFQYLLTIKTEQVQHTVEVGDASMPEKLLPLVNKIRILSRSTPNQ